MHELIDDLEVKNEEIIKLEKLKNLTSLGSFSRTKSSISLLVKLFLKYKYNIVKYKNRDSYIDNCIEIVNGLAGNISQILSDLRSITLVAKRENGYK